MKATPLIRLDALAQALERGGQAAQGYESENSGHDPEHDQFLDELRRWREVLDANVSKVGVFGSIDDRGVSLMQSFLAGEGERHGAEVGLDTGGYEAKFDNLDPGWTWSLHAWLKGLRKHAFVVADAAPQAISNDYRMALLSDWGTGLYGAPVCAKSIERDPRRIDLVVHLGDVYYAGDDNETKDRFLAFWPHREDALSRALNGNHEMYTGGNGYFELILRQFTQPTSYFALRNDHWLLVALDTAYAEHDLHGDQAGWLIELARANPEHRILLFSHHQPFSYFDSGGPKLVHKLSPLLMQGRVSAWYWGHEHACVRYDPHPVWKLHGRCVGHSGFPYFRFLDNGRPAKTQWVRCPAQAYVPGCLVLDGPNPHVAPDASRYGPNGYVIIELRGNKIYEAYCDPLGTVLGEYEF
jgi:hypothetical protein